MTIIQAINRLDALKPNTYSTRQKILWLSQLEAMVKRQVMGIREEEVQTFPEDADTDTLLIMPLPFDAAYLYWLEAQIHYANEDIRQYNSAMQMFNTVFRAYKGDYGHKKITGRFLF